ncbi:START domain-containing protein 10 [Saguinus oedipus]|uniref:START domain-containing protein 10 n=1 Tax=Saguinus oedipus TaxID=9490 RepID=A0ABQ9UV17_SAGOE|nr:START domain-containing protein 10 [Saguinus oedipus]
MEKPAASTESQGPRPVLGRESVQVPDDQDFRSFRLECEAEVGWNLTYSKAGVSVWVQAVEMDRTLHKIKGRLGVWDPGNPPPPGDQMGQGLVKTLV